MHFLYHLRKTSMVQIIIFNMYQNVENLPRIKKMYGFSNLYKTATEIEVQNAKKAVSRMKTKFHYVLSRLHILGLICMKGMRKMDLNNIYYIDSMYQSLLLRKDSLEKSDRVTKMRYRFSECTSHFSFTNLTLT